MRYLLMVSHGTFAPGLRSVLSMLVGERPTILSCSLEDGMGAEEYLENLAGVIAPLRESDEMVLLGDIIGGSPLTNAMALLAERGMLGRTMTFGGMNLPMAMAAAMGLDTQDDDALRKNMLAEGVSGLRELELDFDADAEGDDEDI